MIRRPDRQGTSLMAGAGRPFYSLHPNLYIVTDENSSPGLRMVPGNDG